MLEKEPGPPAFGMQSRVARQRSPLFGPYQGPGHE